MPPLGPAYLSAFLKKHNYDVSVLDLSIFLYSKVEEKYKKYWDSNKGYYWYVYEEFSRMPFIKEHLYDEFAGNILSLESDVLGFSIQNTSALFTLEIIKRIKELARLI